MDNYYIDSKGRVTKKKKQEQVNYKIDAQGNVTKLNNNDLGPVKQTTNVGADMGPVKEMVSVKPSVIPQSYEMQFTPNQGQKKVSQEVVNNIKKAAEMPDVEKYKATGDINYMYQNLQKIIDDGTKLLAETPMDGTDHSVFEEMQALATMSNGAEKKKRKQAVLKKMEAIGLNPDDYALYTDDKNFSWEHFGKWLKNSAMKGVTTADKGLTDLLDVTVGKTLENFGWEDNPISKLSDDVDKALDAYTYDEYLYGEALGGGKGYQVADMVGSGVIAAAPQAMAALGSAGKAILDTGLKQLNKSLPYLQRAGLTIANAMKNPQYWLSFASTWGTGVKEAQEKGATESEAYLAATVSSLINAHIEMGLDGGSGIQGLPEKVAKGGRSAILDWAISSGQEGGEELLQGIVDRAVSKAVYGSEEKIFDAKTMATEYALGTAVGGVLGAGQIGAQSIVSNLKKPPITANEQAVIDALVEEKAAGKELTPKERKALEKEIKEDLQNGQVDIETIERVLGGETYENYKAITDKEAEIRSQIEAVKGNKVLSNEYRQKLIKAYENDLAELEKTSGKAMVQAKLRTEVDKLTQNDSLLRESYNEKARRGQKYEADLNLYTGEGKNVIQSVMEKGIINNSKRTHDYFDLLANIASDTETPIHIATSKEIMEMIRQREGENFDASKYENKVIDGFFDPKTGEIVLNVNSQRALNFILGHELTHRLELTGHYGDLAKVVMEYAATRSDFESKYGEVKRKYKSMYNQDASFEQNVQKEFVAEMVGEFFTDKAFVKHLYTSNSNAFTRLFNEIKHLYKLATAGSKEARMLERAKHTFEQVYREANAENGKSDSERGEIKLALESTNNPGKLNPRTVTREDVRSMLEKVQEETIYGNTYIPIRINTPSTLIYWAKKKRGDVIDNNPIAISAEKAYNAMNREGETGRGRSNKLTIDEIISMIEKMNEPQYIVYQGANDRYVEVIQFGEEGGNKAFAVVEIGNDKNEVHMNGFEGGLYNILVTTYPPKAGKLQELLSNSENEVIFDKTKDVPQRTSSSTVPSVLNDTSFYEDIIAEEKLGVNEKDLHERLSGDALLDAQDLIAEIQDVAEVSSNGYVTLYHRTTKENAKKIMETKKMSAKEDGIFFSTKADGENFVGYGEAVIKLKVPVEKTVLDDIFADEAHLRIPLENRNQVLDVSEYLLDHKTDADTRVSGDGADDPLVKHSLSTEGQQDFGPVGNYNVYGRDVMLDGDIGPVREDIVTRQQETYGTHPITMEEYANNDAPIWKNVGYEDEATKSSITRQVHNEMVAAESVVTVSEEIMQKVGESLPDLRSMKKKDRNSILKESFIRLKSNLRQFLGGVSNQGFEFEVNGAILDAKLYGTGINEVLEKVTKEKAEMLYSTKEIFKNARYLYSTPDYDGDPNVYRWNYFYTPVQIGEQTVGVRIAIRDVVKGTNLMAESQIYNWGIKKDTSLDGGSRGPKVASSGVSSDASTNIIPQNSENTTEIFSDQEDIGPVREVETTPMEDIGPVREDIKAPAKGPLEDIGPVREDIAPLPETEAAGKEESDGQQAIETVEEKYEAKLAATQEELERSRENRAEAYEDYTRRIEEAQAKYDAKKDKNTKTAHTLLRSIERMKRIRDSIDADYSKRISDIEKRLAKMEDSTYKTAMQRKAKQQEYTELMKKLIGDTSTWVDKKLGISYKVNTLRRNLRDIVRDEKGNRDIAKADRIYEELQGKYNHNEAMLKRESNAIKKPYADMKITSAEDAYIQMLGEYKYNPDTELTAEVMQEYFEKHKEKIDVEKVDRIIEEARKTYDMLLARVNEVLREHGMKEIPYRQGYFPHFTDAKQGWLAKLLNWKTQKNEIPTDIAGMTENFKPNRSWQSFNKQRTSDITDYSFTQGLDTYVHGALDWIYHIEDIQKRRALENYIRYSHSEQGLKDRIDAIRNSDEYDADEMQEQIDLAYKEARNPLNNFVVDLRTQTNTLAGKKHSMDRGMEEWTNRTAYTTMTNISNRVTGNMVAGSVSSALTNFIPITQSWGQVSPFYSLRAMGDTIRATFRDDGVVDKSDFLTNRLRGEENLHKGVWDKISEKAGLLMEAVDGFTSQTVWRSKYLQNISKGMSENEAIRNADQFAENVMAGRSRGNMPTIFDAKNPVIKAMTAFQLEVNNQYGYMFKDMPQDMQSESKGKLISGYVAMFVGAYAYNALYSSLTGRDSAFDPIGILEELLKDMGVFGGDDDEEKKASDVMMGLTDNVLDELPFVSGIMGGGRIPISSVFPYGEGIYETVEGTLKDIDDKNWKKLTKEWLNPAWYLAIPVGGGQMRKTWQGLKMFDDDLPISGSYTDSGNLRFPVEDTVGNRIKAGIFGQYSSKNAREYFDRGESPLNEKQIQEYKELEMSIQDYWDYRKGLKKLNSTEGTTLGDKVDYIAGLDASVKQKNIMVNNIAKREKKLDMSNYDMFEDFEEFDFYSKNPEKYTISKAIGGYKGYKKYTKALTDIEADKDKNGNDISGSVKKKRIAYINSLDALDYGQRIILYRSMYSSKEDKKKYNQDILDYLATRNDLSYKEKITILEELEFTINGDGTVSW